MINTKLLTPGNFIIIGLVSLLFAMLVDLLVLKINA